MLYIRMFLTMIVGLYTSRVVLNVLGVEDYGIYGVVGGVVAMLGFLNASMSGATSRFLTFELGRGNQKRLADTFSSALIVHIGIAIIVLIVAETVGLWFLNHKLVIPESRMPAAHWVYQCSIISAMLNITQVPYNAAIIAHEKMDVYAYVEILNVTLKLLIVYLLTIGNFDKLILYAILVLAVSALIMMVYRIYCLRHFKESHFHFIWDKAILKPLLSFSGWDLYGNSCVAFRQQGTNFLINMFFGVAYNAASALATIVNGIINSLVSNVIQAYRPVIIKDYSSCDLGEMQNNMNNAVKLMCLLFACISAPFFIEMPYLFKLWLVNVPNGVIDFCRILLISCYFGLFVSVINIGIHASGNIKLLSTISGTIYLLIIPITYFLFIKGYSVDYAYKTCLCANVLIACTNLTILKHLIKEIRIRQLIKSFLMPTLIMLLSSSLSYFVYLEMKSSFLRVGVVAFLNVVFVISLALFFILDEKQKLHLYKLLNNIFFQKFRSHEGE